MATIIEKAAEHVCNIIGIPHIIDAETLYNSIGKEIRLGKTQAFRVRTAGRSLPEFVEFVITVEDPDDENKLGYRIGNVQCTPAGAHPAGGIGNSAMYKKYHEKEKLLRRAKKFTDVLDL